MINDAINKLFEDKELDYSEINEVFDEILSGVADDVKAASFLTLLKFRELNGDDISRIIKISKEFVKKTIHNFDNKNIIENITFSDKKNYLDIALIVDIIAASNNLCAAKYFVSDEKSFNILKYLGCNFEKNYNEYNSEFEKTNYIVINLENSNNPYIKYAEPLRRRLPFDSIFNIVSKFLNPYCAKNCFLGVRKKEDSEFFADICLKLGYENSIIVYNGETSPFISLDCENYICEAWKNKIFTYNINTELLGLKPALNSVIECESIEHNAKTIIEIFQNKIKDERFNLAVINAAFALYISKKAPSILDGIELAKKTITSSLAFEKLEEIKKAY